MDTTDHFLKKGRERTGINKKGQKKLLENAITSGLTVNDIRNKSDLYNYIKGITKPGHKSYIYSNHIIITSEDDIGITVLNLPKQYIPIVVKLKKQKKGDQCYD